MVRKPTGLIIFTFEFDDDYNVKHNLNGTKRAVKYIIYAQLHTMFFIQKWDKIPAVRF